MTYKELQELTEGRSLPLFGKNEDGENVIIEHRTEKYTHDLDSIERVYFKISTAQHNGWMKIVHIYDDGSVEGFYRK